MGNKKVGPAIAVVVTKSRTRRPAGITAQPRLGGHVAEGAIVVVVVENNSSKTGNQQIGPTVIIKVSNGGPHRPAGITDTGLLRHIGERTIVVVMEESTACFFAGQRHVDSGRVGKVDVWPAVAIIVDECDAAAHRLHNVLLGWGRQMIKLDFRGARDVDKLGKLGVWLRRRRLEWLGVGLTR